MNIKGLVVGLAMVGSAVVGLGCSASDLTNLAERAKDVAGSAGESAATNWYYWRATPVTETVVVRTAPPPVRYEVRPAAPTQRSFWVPGHWKWTGVQYEWIGGHWETQRAGWVYVNAHWDKLGGVWRYQQGYWRRA